MCFVNRWSQQYIASFCWELVYAVCNLFVFRSALIAAASTSTGRFFQKEQSTSRKVCNLNAGTNSTEIWLSPLMRISFQNSAMRRFNAVVGCLSLSDLSHEIRRPHEWEPCWWEEPSSCCPNQCLIYVSIAGHPNKQCIHGLVTWYKDMISWYGFQSSFPTMVLHRSLESWNFWASYFSCHAFPRLPNMRFIISIISHLCGRLS